MSGGFFFNGRRYVSPAVASMVDESAMFNSAGSVGNRLAILGVSEYGAPNTVLKFGSPSEARAVLRTGELLRAVEKAFDPSAQTVGPAEVCVVRVGAPTQASAVLTDADGNIGLQLTSTDYGSKTNGIQVRVEGGSQRGKKLTVRSDGVSYVGDNLSLVPLTLAYTGGGSSPRYSIDGSALVLRVSGSVVGTFVLANYSTIASLVDALNTVSGFVAVAASATSNLSPSGLLDARVNTDLTGTPAEVTAHNRAVADWINGATEGLINAVRQEAKVIANTAGGFVSLTGGTTPATTFGHWQKAFDLLQTEDVQWVVPISSDASIHAMASAHVSFMSTVSQQERRAVCGTALGTSDDDARTAALALNNDRVSLVHIGVYDFDAAGVLTLYPPYIAAAQVAGGMAGQNPGSSMTNKTLKCQGLERKLTRPQTDALIDGGVMPLHTGRRGHMVTKAISTWLSTSNFNRVEVSCGVALDYTARSVREAVEEVIGAKGTALALADVLSRADTVLRRLATAEPAGPGVLAGDEENPAFKDLTVRLSGDTFIVEFQASPVIPLNYGGIVIHAVPYSGTASA